jgi:hypothetical protein
VLLDESGEDALVEFASGKIGALCGGEEGGKQKGLDAFSTGRRKRREEAYEPVSCREGWSATFNR